MNLTKNMERLKAQLEREHAAELAEARKPNEVLATRLEYIVMSLNQWAIAHNKLNQSEPDRRAFDMADQLRNAVGLLDEIAKLLGAEARER